MEKVSVNDELARAHASEFAVDFLRAAVCGKKRANFYYKQFPFLRESTDIKKYLEEMRRLHAKNDVNPPDHKDRELMIDLRYKLLDLIIPKFIHCDSNELKKLIHQ